MNENTFNADAASTPESGVKTGGGSSSFRRASAQSKDQPTIITNRPPTPCPATADSAARIIEGRVMPGDRIGHFELVEFVGGGGMGRVFRAKDTKLGRIVALKILPPEHADDFDARQRFQNEAQSAARLDHENIARVYCVGEDRDLSYIITEFIDGKNLRSLVERRGPLPLEEAISYTLQIAEALAHADSRNVVHRDIKPSNVLVTPEGRVKLIDMGLARMRQDEPGGDDLTASGVTLGTFDYISPEQARDPRHADTRSDIYSLGCTLFYLLSGQPPFPDGTVLQKLLQHQGDRPPDILGFRPELPDEFRQVLEKMMAKDPRRRYSAPSELIADLILLAEQMGLRPMSPASRIWLTPPSAPPVPFFRRHLPWMMPVASLLCVVLLLDRFWARRDNSPPQSQPSNVELAKAPAAAEQPPLVAPAPADNPLGETFPDPFGDGTYTLSPDQWTGYFPITPTGKQTSPPADDPESVPLASTTPAEKATLTKPDIFEAIGSLWKDKSKNLPSYPLLGDVSPDAAAKQQRVLTVCDTAKDEGEFTSLASACAAAKNGDVVELRYNGPREERPMKLANLQLTVRPGKGFQPVVVFRPDEINPVQYPRSMFTLSAGRLTLIDLAIELHVPRDLPADDWTLIETWGGQSLRLERCSLTVRNASDQLLTYHPEVAFIRARPAPDAGMSIEGGQAATPLASVELIDSIARGEAIFLRVEELQSVHLFWDNGLLVTTDMLLSAGGGEMAPKPNESLRIELRNLTAVVHGGLCRLTSTPSNPYQLTVQFVCTDDIFMTAPGVPLIEQEGAVGVAQSRSRIVWNGDRNYYQDVDVFWMVRNSDPNIQPETMSFEAWKTYWGPSRESCPSREPLVWASYPSLEQPLHSHTVADYTLGNNPSLDGVLAAPGCRNERLPSLVPDPLPQRQPLIGDPEVIEWDRGWID